MQLGARPAAGLTRSTGSCFTRCAFVASALAAPFVGGAAEDFSFFLKEVPGLFFYVGAVPRGQDPATAAPNHSPNFMIDESALVVGVRALSSVAVNFLIGAQTD